MPAKCLPNHVCAKLDPNILDASMAFRSHVSSTSWHIGANVFFRPKHSREVYNGFSLIELVIVISILGVLVAIALPAFRGVQTEAQVSQAKNALATIVKECVVAELRGKPTQLRYIKAAKASLSGYRLSNGGIAMQGSSAYENSSCFSQVRWPPGSAPEKGIAVFADPISTVQGQAYASLPQFMIMFKQPSGSTEQICRFWWGDPSVKSDGCEADEPEGDPFVNGGNPQPQYVTGNWN